MEITIVYVLLFIYVYMYIVNLFSCFCLMSHKSTKWLSFFPYVRMCCFTCGLFLRLVRGGERVNRTATFCILTLCFEYSIAHLVVLSHVIYKHGLVGPFILTKENYT